MWDVVYEQVERSAGNNWSVDDIKSLYNFAKVVSPVHLNTLDDYVTAHVDLERMAVNPKDCLLYTSPSPRDGLLSRMPSSA